MKTTRTHTHFLLIGILLLSISEISAQSQSQYASGWSVNNDADWTPFPPNTNPLGAPNDFCTGTSTPTGDWAQFTFPAFTIPAMQPVVGIEIRVKLISHASNTLQLTLSGALTGATRNTPAHLPMNVNCSNTAFVTSGADNDLWGTMLTAADFNAGNVGVRITQNANTIDIDAIEMIVYYGVQNADPDCSMASIPQQNANANCQAIISGSNVSGITDPDMDMLTIMVSPTTLNLGMNIVTVTADDGNGGSCMTTVNVNVVDNTPPSITCPANITVECLAAVPACNPNLVTVSDNCSTMTPTCSDAALVGTECNGSIVRTYRVEDGSGNSAQCNQTIFIVTPAPTFNSLPGDITLPCNQMPMSSLLGWTRGSGSCQRSGQVAGTIIGSVGLCEGSVTEMWTFTDDCGQTIDHQRTINYKIDQVPPVLSGVPSDIFIPCGSPLPAWPEGISATDNCDGALPVSRTQTQAGTRCGNIFYERIWTAQDECGNKVSAKQTIRFLDETPPVLEVPKDTVIHCGSPVPLPKYHSYDACSWNRVVFSEKRTNHNDCEYTLVRTWTATDGCNLSTQKTQTIKVVDEMAPVIQVVNPLLKNLNVGEEMTVYDCRNPQVFLSDVKIQDCCKTVKVEAYDDLLSHGSCVENGFHQRWRCGYIATDAAGNTSEFYFFVNLVDTVAPEFTYHPEDTFLSCDSDVPSPDSFPAVMFTDNCLDMDTAVLFETVYYDPSDSSEFALKRTWTATDKCGNSSQIFQWIFTCDFDTLLLNDLMQPDSLPVEGGLFKIVSATGPGNKGQLSAFPNPTRREFTLTWDSYAEGRTSIRIFDSRAKLLQEKNLISGIGHHSLNLSLENNPPGWYRVLIEYPGGVESISLILLN